MDFVDINGEEKKCKIHVYLVENEQINLNINSLWVRATLFYRQHTKSAIRLSKITYTKARVFGLKYSEELIQVNSIY